ncbi:MAG: PQQ-binding-like beta-propeller repeat protein [Peptostreptococcaceae bacterium]
MKNNYKLACIASILGAIIFVSGCSDTMNSTNDTKETEIEVIQEEDIEEPLTSIQTSYLSNDILSYKTSTEFEHDKDIVFQNKYSEIEGIFTFRGNSLRNSPSFGTAEIKDKNLEVIWEFNTSSSTWGGGAGWTGQPSIIKWPKELRESMNIYDEFKSKEDLTEVIYASLDGSIYFFELETGKQTRDKIKVGNPIKGSVSIDPRGVPLLYVGEGINERGTVGFNIYSLIDGSQLYELNGSDSYANRGWPAFDSSAIVNEATDSVVVGGENGLLYNIKLNTNYDKENNTISIEPKINKYNFSSNLNQGRLGIENSVAAYANLSYFADNGGVVQCVDLNTLQPVWALDGYDDMDATLTVDIEDSKPYVYCGNEVDHQGTKGVSKLKKIDGISGEVIWEREFVCESLLGKKPNNGGLMATNIVGKNSIDDLVIFSLARYDGFNKGGTFALNKDTGEIVWETLFDNYMWSSPVDVYDSEGNAYILQGDSAGYLHILDGKTGEILNSVQLNANIESSPAVFNDIAVLATRGGTMYGVKIK